MAFNMYPFGYAELLRTNIRPETHTLKLLATRTGYTFNSANKYLSDITSTLRNAHTAVTVTNIDMATTTPYGLQADTQYTLPTPTGTECTGILLYRDTGTESTSQLIAHWSGTDYTFTPDSTNRVLNFNNSQLIDFAPSGRRMYGNGMSYAFWLYNFLTSGLYFQFVDGNDYTPNYTTAATIATIPSGAKVGPITTIPTTGRSVTDAGTLNLPTITVTGVTGDPTEYGVVCINSTATGPLIALCDTTEMQITPSGGNVTVAFPNGLLSLQ